jgi:hypothetical protein
MERKLVRLAQEYNILQILLFCHSTSSINDFIDCKSEDNLAIYHDRYSKVHRENINAVTWIAIPPLHSLLEEEEERKPLVLVYFRQIFTPFDPCLTCPLALVIRFIWSKNMIVLFLLPLWPRSRDRNQF